MKSLKQIKAEVDRLAKIIGVTDRSSLPTCGSTQDFARPHIEVDAQGYHFVVVERGREWSRLTTKDIDALLYRIFRSVTHDLASSHELSHRIEEQDCRRILFQKQITLLSQLSESWGRRRAQEHEQIFRTRPFDDWSGVRAQLSAQVGWAKACERYPLPKGLPKNGGDAALATG
jgi:hypothetical protein